MKKNLAPPEHATKTYEILWLTGDTGHTYDSLPDAVQALRYHAEKDAVVVIVDAETLEVRSFELPAVR